jgi:predicted alpha/beta superfamily hydrolase
MRNVTRLCIFVTALFTVPVSGQQPAPVSGPASAVSLPDGVPVTVARAKQYDLKSKINGQTYRIMVSMPFMADPAAAYPALYILDGNWFFNTTADAITLQAPPGTVAPAIVVGVGYPTDDREEVVRRRAFDMTPSASRDPANAGSNGGADAFLRVLEEEIKPFIRTRYRVDDARQIIWGHSLGGLIALRSLFRNPTAFSTYIISSPSIWWNDKEVLQDEEGFAKRVKAGDLRLRVLVLSAANEQYRGDDPKLRAADTARMVNNASELAARLSALRPANMFVERTILDDEGHLSDVPASLSRALRFALPPK